MKYDKSAIMKTALAYVKAGLHLADALRQAWAEAKEQAVKGKLIYSFNTDDNVYFTDIAKAAVGTVWERVQNSNLYSRVIRLSVVAIQGTQKLCRLRVFATPISGTGKTYESSRNFLV